MRVTEDAKEKSVKSFAMAPQSSLRFFKHCHIHCQRKDLLAQNWREVLDISPGLRGLYVLYKKRNGSKIVFDPVYLGVGGVKKEWGIGARLQWHARKRQGWTHFSIFEAHDNVSGADILEMESFLLQIFGRDSRPRLQNRQVGSKAFAAISGT
jgi:hypothetical protein